MVDISNISFAWVSSIILLMLSIVYPFRKLIQKKKLAQDHWVAKANKGLRKIHKILGVFVIGVLFLHCRLSSQKFGFNTGTLCLLITILLLLSYMLRKQIRGWMKYHRFLTALLWGVLILHIILTRIF